MDLLSLAVDHPAPIVDVLHGHVEERPRETAIDIVGQDRDIDDFGHYFRQHFAHMTFVTNVDRHPLFTIAFESQFVFKIGKILSDKKQIAVDQLPGQRRTDGNLRIVIPFRPKNAIITDA